MSSANLAQSLLAQAARIALSHGGEITVQERTAIRDLCLQFNIPPTVVKQVFLAIKQQLEDEEYEQKSPPEKRVSTLTITLPENNQEGFHHLVGLTIGQHNHLFVTDSSHHWISQINTNSNMTILAGTGSKGHHDGPALEAQFNHPGGLARDSKNNIYVADTENNCIRMYSPDGLVSTVAGSNEAGFQDGRKANAKFNSPGDVIIDSNDIIYLSDTENHAIRCIMPDGEVKTIAGDGQEGYKDGFGPSAQFKNPWGLARDSKNNIYVADTGNHCIRKITQEYYVTTLAGNGERGIVNGKGQNARFNRPFGLSMDHQNNLYIADFFNNCIRKVDHDDLVTTFAGSTKRGYEDGSLQEALFAWPIDLTIDAHSKMYIADWANKAIRCISLKDKQHANS